MKHIVNFSGGKDSTAMLLKMIEKDMPIDEIIFCDTGKEFPEMYEHIEKVEKYINIPITKLKSMETFDELMFEHIKTKGKNKGQKGYSWPGTKIRWCTTKLKTQMIEQYLRKYKGEEIIHYIGIAFLNIRSSFNDLNGQHQQLNLSNFSYRPFQLKPFE
mgnify:CR=1 FL=1